MRFLIYTYGNHRMGMGHVYRMLSLAARLKDEGHSIQFLMPEWEAGIAKVQEFNYEIIRIDIDSFENREVYKKIMNSHCSDSVFNCTIADALNVRDDIMKLFSSNSKLLISLDNTGSGRFYSDILINVLYRTEPKLGNSGIEYNGFEYLIIDPNFREYNLKPKQIKKNIEKLLITQGGSDTYAIIPKIINDLKDLAYSGECIVLIGPAFKHYDELKFAIENSDLNIKVLKDIKYTWKLFYDADLAITGGGNTLFELLCVGTPSITLTGENKELDTMDYLREITVMLGLYDNIQKGVIKSTVKDLLSDYNKRNELSARGKVSIDGAGIERLLNLIYQKIGHVLIVK